AVSAGSAALELRVHARLSATTPGKYRADRIRRLRLRPAALVCAAEGARQEAIQGPGSGFGGIDGGDRGRTARLVALVPPERFFASLTRLDIFLDAGALVLSYRGVRAVHSS